MSAPTNHWKLGAFVLGSVLAGAAVVVFLAAQALQVSTVTYKSYFDEAVTGLEAGSPISFRGVRIGNVSAIDVAPDRRHVEITYLLGVSVLARLGLAGETHGQETKITVPEGLRVQIASTGLTGTKYLQLDFFETHGAPPPQLPFPVPENTIPAMPSTMKNLEDAIVRAVDMIPELAREAGGTIARVNLLLDDVAGRKLPVRTAATLEAMNRALATLQRKLDEVPAAELSRDGEVALKSATLALTSLSRVLDHLDASDGLLASVKRTSDRFGDAAGPKLGANLNDTGRDLREMAVALRQLVEALQRDPDMLLKGKAKVLP